VDPSEPADAAPNFSYDPATETVDINRQLTDCSGPTVASLPACVNADPGSTGYNVTKLQFRVTGLSTSVLLAETSPGGSASDAHGAWTLAPLMLQPPAGSTGGLNSVLLATPDLPQGGLAPGQSIDVEFQFAVQTPGSFSFAYNAEDDLKAVSVTSTAPITPVAGAANAAPITSVTTGTIGASSATVTMQSATKTHTIKKSKKHQKKHQKKHRAKKRKSKHRKTSKHATQRGNG